MFTGMLVVGAAGCSPSNIMGPLAHEEDEREHLMMRAEATGSTSDLQLIDRVVPQLTPSEHALADEQTSSCRSSYMWKNALTWTGSLLIAGAAGFTIGGAYVTGNDDNTGKIAAGVSAASLATLGGGLVAIGGIIANGFTDRGCVSKISAR